MAKVWVGEPPKDCQICARSITSEFIDGKTTKGPWAMMCIHCHHECGVGLGTGKGQRYTLQSDEEWHKVEG